MRYFSLLLLLFSTICFADLGIIKNRHTGQPDFILEHPFTVIAYDYPQVMRFSRDDVQRLIKRRKDFASLNRYINFLGDYLSDRPYSELGTQGEGDWCNASKRGCVHLQQDPIYRTDAFDCQTLVQLILALVESHSLNEFNRNIIKINYGAAGSDKIAFYNRNNFISGDWNPVNQKNGFIRDATRSGLLAHYTRYTSAIINRQHWFSYFTDAYGIKYNVRVIHAKDGFAMRKRMADNYPNKYHVFKKQKVTIDYLPKTAIITVKKSNDNVTYTPNNKVINALPTPSVLEIVRNTKVWYYHGQLVKKAIGSNLNVSHLGILYDQHFKHGQLIYHKVTCAHEKICVVTPIYCQKKHGCNEKMFLHATDAFPNKYYFYNDSLGHYHCTPTKPFYGEHFSRCNRVMALPIQDYFLRYEYGRYLYMKTKSILGVHLEKIV